MEYPSPAFLMILVMRSGRVRRISSAKGVNAFKDDPGYGTKAMGAHLEETCDNSSIDVGQLPLRIVFRFPW